VAIAKLLKKLLMDYGHVIPPHFQREKKRSIDFYQKMFRSHDIFLGRWLHRYIHYGKIKRVAFYKVALPPSTPWLSKVVLSKNYFHPHATFPPRHLTETSVRL